MRILAKADTDKCRQPTSDRVRLRRVCIHHVGLSKVSQFGESNRDVQGSPET